MLCLLRTAENAPGPEAITANRKGVSETIRLIRFYQVATAAICTGGEIEDADAVSESYEVFSLPGGYELLFAHAAELATEDPFGSLSNIAAIGVQEGRAGAYATLPGDGNRTGLDEGTEVAPSIQVKVQEAYIRV